MKIRTNLSLLVLVLSASAGGADSVGLKPLTVAWWAIGVPTVALAGCWVVVIVDVMTTGSAKLLATEKLLASPLYTATQ